MAATDEPVDKIKSMDCILFSLDIVSSVKLKDKIDQIALSFSLTPENNERKILSMLSRHLLRKLISTN
tara:strand:- start:15 stop:218 length:204 start_codon:yes stop_codon:yes gene_type:complete